MYHLLPLPPPFLSSCPVYPGCAGIAFRGLPHETSRTAGVGTIMTIIVSSLLAILLLLLGSGIWIGIGLAATGSAMLMLFRDIPIGRLLAQYTWNILTTQELLALPMFIVMGEVLFRTRLSQSLFNGLSPWASLLPGRLDRKSTRLNYSH